MPVPISYNVRNLAVRRITSLMTALSAALSVAVLVAVLALVQGLKTSFEVAGNPDNLLVLRKGATSELISVISPQNFQDIKAQPGIARDAKGEPLASLELVEVINLAGGPGGRDMNVNIRGVTPVAFEMRNQVRTIEGRLFQPGRRELVVGKSIAERFPSAHVGGTLHFGRGEWTVTGVLSSDGSVFDGEVWGDLNQLSADEQRADALSSVLVRAEPGQRDALVSRLEQDRRLNVLAQPERQYYAEQMESATPVQFMGTFVAIIMAVGSAFAAMNTMYAAVARRRGEIGTLRVLGFTRGSILLSFVLESTFLSVIGGMAGCVLAWPLNYVHTDVGSFTTWSHFTFSFRVNGETMVAGLVFAGLIGLVGGFLPARNAARLEVMAALKAR